MVSHTSGIRSPDNVIVYICSEFMVDLSRVRAVPLWMNRRMCDYYISKGKQNIFFPLHWPWHSQKLQWFQTSCPHGNRKFASLKCNMHGLCFDFMSFPIYIMSWVAIGIGIFSSSWQSAITCVWPFSFHYFVWRDGHKWLSSWPVPALALGKLEWWWVWGWER